MTNFLPPHLTGPTPLEHFQSMHREHMQAQARTHALLAELIELLRQQQPTKPEPPAVG